MQLFCTTVAHPVKETSYTQKGELPALIMTKFMSCEEETSGSDNDIISRGSNSHFSQTDQFGEQCSESLEL
jgi:hypothetical protein